MSENPLLGNIDRTVFTFNMHNVSEMCFNHVFKRKTLSQMSSGELTPAHQKKIDDCITKYM